MEIKRTALYGFQQAFMLLFLMALTGFYALHLGQDSNFDLRNYHWYNAYSFLHHRFDIDIAAASKPTYNNPLLDSINYLIIQVFPKAKRAEFALGTIHGISLYFLLNIGLLVFKQSRFKWFYAIIASLLGVTGVASLHQIGTTYNESQVTVFVMASLFFFTKAIDENNQRYTPYFFAAFILGLGVAAKLTAISYGLGLFLSFFVFKAWDVKRFKIMVVTGIAFLIGFFLVDGWWMWKLYRHFQNPLFPYYNTIFHSSYVADIDMTYKEWVPKTLGQALLYPVYWLQENTVTTEFYMKDPRFAVTFILGLIWFLKRIYQKWQNPPIEAPKNALTIRFLLLFFIISYCIWMIQFSVYRYTIPLNFLAGILIIYFSQVLFDTKKIQIPFMIFATCLILQQTDARKWDRMPYFKYFFTLELPKKMPENSLILVGWPAVSYLAAYFPPSNQFIGYYNYMMQPNNPKLYHKALDVIQNFKGPLYMILTDDNRVATEQNLKLHDLKIIDPCETIKSNLEVIPIRFCSITRV